MKITQLDIEGFRSLKNVSWKPGDLNVIIGPNGSGKSNLLMLLELISASAQGKLNDFITAASGMTSLLWDGQANSVSFRLSTDEYSQEIDFGIEKATIHLPPLSYYVDLLRVGQGSSYVLRTENLEILGSHYKMLERTRLKINVRDGEGMRPIISTGQPEEETTISFTGLFTTNDIFIPYRYHLIGWRIYQSILTTEDSPLRQAVISRPDKFVASDGRNLINVLHSLYTTDRTFEESINSAMRAAFGNDFDKLVFPPDYSDQRVQLRVRWKTLKRETSAADLSDGTLRFLLLLAILATPDPPPLIAIDEPETGLHPTMLPIIAEYAVDAARRTQVIMTTHSDQFLDAFGDTKPTTTVAKWENGETTLTVLGEDELAYWLKDYSLGKLFRTGELEALA